MVQDQYFQSPIGGKTALDVSVSNTPLSVYVINDPSGVTPQVVTPIYNGITAVATTTLTTLLTYTVPVAKTFYAIRAQFSGTNIALYQIYFNGVLYGQARTYFGGGLDGMFDLESFPNTGYKLSAGDIVTLKVEHFRPNVGDFDATLVGLLVG